MIGRQVVTLLAVFVAWTTVVLQAADGLYLQSPYEYQDSSLDRDKRYTETQDRASSFCTGMCMYEQRKAYGDCYDLCNWNGKGASPWSKLENKSPKFDADQENQNLGNLMRSGSGGGKMKPLNKSKQPWRKREIWR